MPKCDWYLTKYQRCERPACHWERGKHRWLCPGHAAIPYQGSRGVLVVEKYAEQLALPGLELSPEDAPGVGWEGVSEGGRS